MGVFCDHVYVLVWAFPCVKGPIRIWKDGPSNLTILIIDRYYTNFESYC